MSGMNYHEGSWKCTRVHVHTHAHTQNMEIMKIWYLYYANSMWKMKYFPKKYLVYFHAYVYKSNTESHFFSCKSFEEMSMRKIIAL